MSLQQISSPPQPERDPQGDDEQAHQASPQGDQQGAQQGQHEHSGATTQGDLTRANGDVTRGASAQAASDAAAGARWVHSPQEDLQAASAGEPTPQHGHAGQEWQPPLQQQQQAEDLQPALAPTLQDYTFPAPMSQPQAADLALAGVPSQPILPAHAAAPLHPQLAPTPYPRQAGSSQPGTASPWQGASAPPGHQPSPLMQQVPQAEPQPQPQQLQQGTSFLALLGCGSEGAAWTGSSGGWEGGLRGQAAHAAPSPTPMDPFGLQLQGPPPQGALWAPAQPQQHLSPSLVPGLAVPALGGAAAGGEAGAMVADGSLVRPVVELTPEQASAMQLARSMRQVLHSLGILPGSVANAKQLLTSGGLTDEVLEYRRVRTCWGGRGPGARRGATRAGGGGACACVCMGRNTAGCCHAAACRRAVGAHPLHSVHVRQGGFRLASSALRFLYASWAEGVCSAQSLAMDSIKLFSLYALLRRGCRRLGGGCGTYGLSRLFCNQGPTCPHMCACYPLRMAGLPTSPTCWLCLAQLSGRT